MYSHSFADFPAFFAAKEFEGRFITICLSSQNLEIV